MTLAVKLKQGNTMKKWIWVGLVASMALAGCGDSHAPKEEDVMQAIVVYTRAHSFDTGGVTNEEALAKTKAAVKFEGCSADESHSTDTARAYTCNVEFKNGGKKGVAHMLLESGQWRITSVEG